MAASRSNLQMTHLLKEFSYKTKILLRRVNIYI